MRGTKRRRRLRGGSEMKKPDPFCQCYNFQTGKACNKMAIEKSLFCQDHQSCPASPTSGCEPHFGGEDYNQDRAVTKSHNCYSYASNVIDSKLVELCRQKGMNSSCRQNFHQPGALNGDRFALNATERRSCPIVEKLMLSDIPNAQKTDFISKCPTGTSKIALVVDPGEDYHFYRQDNNGMWSHKDGSNKAKRYDALKRDIFNPQLASRDYRWQGSDLNYTDFCGFYCVPRDHKIVLGQGGASPAVGAGTRRRQQKRRQQGGQPGTSWKDHQFHRRQTRRRHRK